MDGPRKFFHKTTSCETIEESWDAAADKEAVHIARFMDSAFDGFRFTID